MDKEILKLIEKSKKDYEKNSQRTELLKRNQKFFKELKKISQRLRKEFFKLKELSKEELLKNSNDNILLKLDYPKIKFMPHIREYILESYRHDYEFASLWGTEGFVDDVLDENFMMTKFLIGIEFGLERDPFFDSLNLDFLFQDPPKNVYEIILCKHRVFQRYRRGWTYFCSKWHIDPKWNGKLSNLSKLLSPLVSIGMDYGNPDFPININIGPWTSWKDVKQRWGDIELLKQTSFTIPKKSPHFNRDLCWYDLKKKYKLSPGKIAKLWIIYCPEDIDLLVIKRVKREEKIELNEEKASELLEEIKTDPAMNELRIQFEKEREIYIEGPYSPFIDLIKKAIKSMNIKIKEFNLPAQEPFFSIPAKE